MMIKRIVRSIRRWRRIGGNAFFNTHAWWCNGGLEAHQDLWVKMSTVLPISPYNCVCLNLINFRVSLRHTHTKLPS